MKQFLKLPRYHWLFVFALCGCFASAFAFTPYNLFNLSMANIKFIQNYGLLAVMEGALYQSLKFWLAVYFRCFFILDLRSAKQNCPCGITVGKICRN